MEIPPYFCVLNNNEMSDFKFPYKKVLILENEIWEDDDTTQLHFFYRKLKTMGVKFTIIDRAAGKPKNDIVKALMSNEVLLFSSTFLYEQDVKGLGDLLGSEYFVNSPKVVIGHVMGQRGNLKYYIEKIWNLEELAKMSHHKVLELVEVHTSLGEPFSEINMKEYKTLWDKREKERITKNHSMPKTGRKVKICDIQAFGPQWSLLKKGDVVDELDCSSIDESPERGVWVMGKDEPVKLLNDNGYEEYEYEDVTSEALVLEFFSRGSRKDRKDLMETLQLWIYKCCGIQLEDGELWEKCDDVCKLIGVERRGNRKYFERRLKEYRSKYSYFREPSGDPRAKKVSAFK